jgi:hypothetical protein
LTDSICNWFNKILIIPPKSIDCYDLKAGVTIPSAMMHDIMTTNLEIVEKRYGIVSLGDQTISELESEGRYRDRLFIHVERDWANKPDPIVLNVGDLYQYSTPCIDCGYIENKSRLVIPIEKSLKFNVLDAKNISIDNGEEIQYIVERNKRVWSIAVYFNPTFMHIPQVVYSNHKQINVKYSSYDHKRYEN